MINNLKKGLNISKPEDNLQGESTVESKIKQLEEQLLKVSEENSNFERRLIESQSEIKELKEEINRQKRSNPEFYDSDIEENNFNKSQPLRPSFEGQQKSLNVYEMKPSQINMQNSTSQIANYKGTQIQKSLNSYGSNNPSQMQQSYNPYSSSINNPSQIQKSLNPYGSINPSQMESQKYGRPTDKDRYFEESSEEGENEDFQKKSSNFEYDYSYLPINNMSNVVHMPQDPRISEDFYRSQSMVLKPTPVFKYEYDFDENGVLYYLGTNGRTTHYRNPHEIGQCRAFCSSLGKGNLADFVGREIVNLRTNNEENSFFGVDLGEERFLIPTSYSLRNRNSTSHVLLCWSLEGSNDGVNYNTLDTRIFYSRSNPKFRKNLEEERNELQKPGCTSTWGITKKVKKNFPNGFRYFRIVQIDKNSSGGYNLALSGFELYGQALGKNWSFY
ncbi:MAG: hypothetical protein MJ252_06940 [archaeon]|nr:hypothetical protein [archaeon]